MGWTASVFVVELQFHGNRITDFRAGSFPNVAVKIKIKASVADGHHVDAPGIFRLAIDADADRERLAPAFSNSLRSRRADEHVGIDFIDGDGRAESQSAHELRI